MQIYYQSSSFIRFSLVVDGSLRDADVLNGQYQVYATVTRIADGTVIINNELVERESQGIYRLSLDPSKTSTLGKYRVVWTYRVSGATNTRTVSFDVVVPYLSASQFRSTFPELSSKSDDEIYRKEQLARKIIETICNQRFDFELSKTYKVLGQDKDTLLLPKRIWSLSSIKIDGTDDITNSVEIHSDYFLRSKKLPWDVNLDRSFFDLHLFRKGVFYHVTGNWGWEFVPAEVQEAAMLMVKDYFTDDYILRQHGILQAQIGDESYRFADELWPSTGNVDADALLSNFIRHRFEVI